MTAPEPHSSGQTPGVHRRGFLASASSLAMASGLLGGYGTMGWMAGRFLYPSKGRQFAWVFVAEEQRLKPGDVLHFKIPTGQTVAITRRASATGDEFLALSSTCPHLGCQVHWEEQHNRFFCPCHNGTFDPSGVATAGPPAEAKQSLPRYSIRVDNGLLFIEVPVA